jgi:predicted secreted protein
MTAISASEFTFEVGDNNTPINYSELGGLIGQTLRILNSSPASHGPAETTAWQQISSQQGTQQLSLSLEGTFTDSNSEQSLQSAALANQTLPCRIILGNGNHLAGSFTITEYEHNAAMEGAVNYRINLQNSSAINFSTTS